MSGYSKVSDGGNPVGGWTEPIVNLSGNDTRPVRFRYPLEVHPCLEAVDHACHSLIAGP